VNAQPIINMRKEISMRDKFTDPRDGNTYNIVMLRDGNWWLAENLRYEMPGSFPAHKNPDEGVIAKNPDYNWKNYGRLYTWDAAKKASPPGWHLPSDREWKKMLNAYGGYGRNLGEWQEGPGRDDIGVLMREELRVEFGGFLDARDSSVPGTYPYFYHEEMLGKFWSTAKYRPHGAYYYRFDMHGRVCKDAEVIEKALSVRCIKD
jgi:uncharacterized protein (TIGR02145 family)